MYFVGVDPSITNTGLVVLDSSGSLCGCVNGRAYDDKRLEPIRRYDRIATWLSLYMEDCMEPPASEYCIGYEDYSYGSVHRGFSLAEFGGVLKLRLHGSEQSSLMLIAPSSNKLFATGHGHATKEEVMAQAGRECQELYKLPKKELTSDICDAYFLAKAAWYANAPAEAVLRNETNRAMLRGRLEMVTEWKNKKSK